MTIKGARADLIIFDDAIGGSVRLRTRGRLMSKDKGKSENGDKKLPPEKREEIKKNAQDEMRRTHPNPKEGKEK